MIARNRAASKAQSGPEAGIPGSTPVQRQNFGEFAGRRKVSGGRGVFLPSRSQSPPP